MIQVFILVAPRRDSSSDETFFEKIKSLNYGAPLLAKFSNGSLTIVKNYNTMTSQKFKFNIIIFMNLQAKLTFTRLTPTEGIRGSTLLWVIY